MISQASNLIQSFFGEGDYDVLITDPKAQLYNRIGLIAMSDVAEVFNQISVNIFAKIIWNVKTIYNLNMTKGDKVNVSIKTGVKQINVLECVVEFQKGLRCYI